LALVRQFEQSHHFTLLIRKGWAGYTFARGLDRKKYHAIIVSPRPYFVFTPLLASTAVGTLEFRTALEPVRSKRLRADYIQGWADSVDFSGKCVTIEAAVEDPRLGLAQTKRQSIKNPHEKSDAIKKGKLFRIHYDKLVIAVGCYSQTFAIPGVEAHAYYLKDVGDAREILQRILTCFENAALPTTSNQMRKYILNFAIVGGGPTGIEFSAGKMEIVNYEHIWAAESGQNYTISFQRTWQDFIHTLLNIVKSQFMT
jgi:NADH dehydrogenase FAD-containing subunit